MATSILVTKLFVPPTRAELVHRPGLIERLKDGLDRKLTLLSAPAGFGKTTLVSHWLENIQNNHEIDGQSIKVAWLSLDNGDNDLTRFLTYFITALNQANGSETALGNGALNMLQAPQPLPVETTLTSLINEIATVPDRIIFILDDYHLIDSQAIHDALTFLLENLPPTMHLIIATREDPLLPLSRLRARGWLTELRAADLRFTSAEAAEFLNQVMGLTLSDEDITALETRTEGWIAGLQLAALSLQGNADTSKLIQSFSGSNRLVLDYLIDEVLNQQPEDIQNFLLQTSILDRLTGSLCDALTGGDNGQQVLDALDRANLFIIPLDEERRWYRYHHLFIDLLRQRLNQIHPDQVKMLHQQASKWNEQHGFMDEAIEHALIIQDFDCAIRLLEAYVDTLWQQGAHRKLPRLLTSVPIELILEKPQLCVYQAWYAFISGQQELAERCLQEAEHALNADTNNFTQTEMQEQDPSTTSQQLQLKGRISAIRSFVASFQGNITGLIQHARQALETLPEQDRYWRSNIAITLGDVYGFKGDMTAAYEARLEAYKASKAAGDIYNMMLASSKLAVTMIEQGRLQNTIEFCQKQIQTATEFGYSKSPLCGFLWVLLGETFAELNELDHGLDLALTGINITELTGNLVFVGWGHISLIRIMFSKGDYTAIEEFIQKLERMAQDSNVPAWIMGLMAIWQIRLWLVQGKLELASRWANDRELNTDIESPLLQEIDFFTLFDYIALTRILIAQDQQDEAAKLLGHLLIIAEKGDRTASMIEILMLQALSYQKQGKTDQAMFALERSLTLAEPEGFIRTFVDEGPPMARLLYEALSHEIEPDYVQRLLRAFPVEETEKTNASQPHGPDSELIEPLSEREIEVLQLIAQGLSNREVGDRLYLTLNTVKSHSRTIYSKLGVNNRTQAVAKARTLGIISNN